ncbi:MAG: hypothetical protein HKL95_09000 [Phycisphaerae bacterium]|nr:hypothetical protein [Phycisphaerae bacterium]
MSDLDWIIFLATPVVVFVISLQSRRYIVGVADFLASRRAGGRYLLSLASGTAGFGAVSAVAGFQLFYRAGTAINWWGNIGLPLALIMTVTGFVSYRYRETRVLTIGQLLEVRYSHNFRIFMGATVVASGVLNYAIFPAVGAHFFIYYCNLPHVIQLGALSVRTFPLFMACELSFALYTVLLGGQLQGMLTDCIEGLISGVLFLVVAGAILAKFSFNEMYVGMASGPPGKSLLNPFDMGKQNSFNVLYVVIGLVSAMYTWMNWQGNQGFNAAPANAHEAKMAGILGNWRGISRSLVIMLLAIAGVTYLKNPEFAAQAAVVRVQLSHIPSHALRSQERMPLALSHLLPSGVRGCFAAMMFLMMVAVDISYLHSWGSIFIQDVVLPLRRRAIAPQRQLRLLRWSITGVAMFAFLFSLLFSQTQYIFMFFAITGAIFLGGSGAVILGALYWSRGTTAGAWAGQLVGSVLAVSGIIIEQIWPHFPLTGQVMYGITMVCASSTYVAVSLATCRKPFNMDRMLHRGIYARAEDAVKIETRSRIREWKKVLLGFDENFTRGDKVISGSFFGWSMLWFVSFVIITVWACFFPWSNRAWWNWNLVQIILLIVLSPLTTIWFTWGVVVDLRRLFVILKDRAVDVRDNGQVIGHCNADEVGVEAGSRVEE